MTLEEVIRSFKTNAGAESLAEYLVENHNRCGLCFERKGLNLVEVVEDFLKTNRFPVVDKKLRLVIGTASGTHSVLRAYLFAYHANKDVGSFDRDADSYVDDGCGYFISDVTIGGRLIVGRRYRPDRFDKQLFLVREPEYF